MFEGVSFCSFALIGFPFLFVWATIPGPRAFGLSEQVERVLQNLLEGLEELRAGRAVNDAMVARHRDPHQLSHDDLPVAHDRLRGHRADGEYGGLRRVYDRRELVNAEHAEVAYGE